MNELIEKVLEELRSAWRYRWWCVLAAWVICAAGWTFVMTIPNVYQSTARVYLDTQSALRPLLRGLAIDPNIESELGLVRQALTGRTQLEKVARQTDLDLNANTAEEKERLMAMLRKSLVISTDVRAANSATDGVYKISFQHTSRAKSLNVVQTLLDNFVEDTLGTKRTGQADAQRFLKEQIAEYEQRLSDAETRLSDFKKQNVGTMPDNRGDYFARLQTELAGLDNAQRSLSLAETRRDEMARQLSGEEPFLFGLDSSSTNKGGASGGGDVATRIRELEARSEELLLRYTEKHPEVIAVKNTLDDLRARQTKELARVQQGQRATGDLSSSLKSNPVYQSIQVELKRTEVQIAELRRDAGQRQARVAEIRRLVDTVPEVEADLAKLNRDYEVTRTQYQQLVQRLETAKLSEEADRTGTVRFQVIDPPITAQEPVAPKRVPMLLAVLVVGIGAGCGLAYVLSQLHPVYQNVRTLRDITGLPVLGFVSRTWRDRHTMEVRRGVIAFSGVMALLVVAFAVLLAISNFGARSA